MKNKDKEYPVKDIDKEYTVKDIDKEYTVKLDEYHIKFTSELLDITFIQFTDTLINEINEEYFLYPCNEDCKKDDIIHIIQYPDGKNFKLANGKIIDIYGFDYLHQCSTENGSSGSPLLNENLKVVGVHKTYIKNKNANIATRFTVVEYAIRNLYNNRHLIGINKSRLSSKLLSDDEIMELYTHGLQKTSSEKIFKIPKTNNSSELLLYRENHAWYWMKRPSNLTEENLKEISKLKQCKWSIIKLLNESNDNNEDYNALSHQQKVIINFLKLT